MLILTIILIVLEMAMIWTMMSVGQSKDIV